MVSRLCGKLHFRAEVHVDVKIVAQRTVGTKALHTATFCGRICDFSPAIGRPARPDRPRSEYKSAPRKVSSANRDRGHSAADLAGLARHSPSCLGHSAVPILLLRRRIGPLGLDFSPLPTLPRPTACRAKTPAGDTRWSDPGCVARSRSEAARLIYVDQESEYYRAKLQAARRLCQGLVTPGDLPSTRRNSHRSFRPSADLARG